MKDEPKTLDDLAIESAKNIRGARHHDTERSFKAGYLKGKADGLEEAVKVCENSIEGVFEMYDNDIANFCSLEISKVKNQIQNLIGSEK